MTDTRSSQRGREAATAATDRSGTAGTGEKSSIAVGADTMRSSQDVHVVIEDGWAIEAAAERLIPSRVLSPRDQLVIRYQVSVRTWRVGFAQRSVRGPGPFVGGPT